MMSKETFRIGYFEIFFRCFQFITSDSENMLFKFEF